MTRADRNLAAYSDQWHTPPEWLEWVAKSLGSVYLDPCDKDWTPDQPSGLDIQWNGAVYINHPGSRGSVNTWWQKLLREIASGRCTLAIWCAFSIEQQRTTQPSYLSLPGYLVQPHKRIPYIWGGETRIGRTYGEPCKSPGNASAFWCTQEPAEPPYPSTVIKTGIK